MAMPRGVLMRDIASAPAPAAALAMLAISAVFGLSLTITGREVAALTAAVTLAADDGSAPKEAPPAQAPTGGIRGATGYRYWTMRISNMDSVMEDVRNAGYNVPVPPMDIGGGVKIAMVEDPDGNWVELVSVG